MFDIAVFYGKMILAQVRLFTILHISGGFDMDFEAIKKAAEGYQADMSKFLSSIIDFMNHDVSMENVLDPTKKINELLGR